MGAHGVMMHGFKSDWFVGCRGISLLLVQVGASKCKTRSETAISPYPIRKNVSDCLGKRNACHAYVKRRKQHVHAHRKRSMLMSLKQSRHFTTCRNKSVRQKQHIDSHRPPKPTHGTRQYTPRIQNRSKLKNNIRLGACTP